MSAVFLKIAQVHTSEMHILWIPAFWGIQAKKLHVLSMLQSLCDPIDSPRSKKFLWNVWRDTDDTWQWQVIKVLGYKVNERPSGIQGFRGKVQINAVMITTWFGQICQCLTGRIKNADWPDVACSLHRQTSLSTPSLGACFGATLLLQLWQLDPRQQTPHDQFRLHNIKATFVVMK